MPKSSPPAIRIAPCSSFAWRNGAWPHAAHRLGIGRCRRRRIDARLDSPPADPQRRTSRHRPIAISWTKGRHWRSSGSAIRAMFINRSIDIAHQHERDKPTDADRKIAADQLKHEAEKQVAVRAKQRTETIEQLLSSTSRRALMLLHSIDARPLPRRCRSKLRRRRMQPDPQIRDLFERFVPAEKRVQRLGNVIDANQLLAVAGDTERGKALFFGQHSRAVQEMPPHRRPGRKAGPGADTHGEEIQSRPTARKNS